MGGNYIETPFVNPTNSVPGPDGKFIVSNPFASLAAARLTNVLRGKGMTDEQIGNHLIKQSMLRLGRWPGTRLGQDGSYPIDSSGGGSYDPTLDPCYVDPASCGVTDTATAPTNVLPADISAILNAPVDTSSVDAIDPITGQPIVTSLPGNWVWDPNTGTFVPGVGGAQIATGDVPANILAQEQAYYAAEQAAVAAAKNASSPFGGSAPGTGGKPTGGSSAGTPSCGAGFRLVQTAQGTMCVNAAGQVTQPSYSGGGLGISSSTLTTLALVVGAGALLIFALD